MPLKISYLTLDVFTSTPYAGNPLAVVLLPTPTTLTQEQKQIIAREFNYSETVFIHTANEAKPENKIDIFMTDAELPFAGHPTIGAAWYLSTLQVETGREGEGGRKVITKAGPIPYSFSEQDQKVYAEIAHDTFLHPYTLSSSLALEHGLPAHLATYLPQSGIPFFSIVKGMTFALIELPSLAALSQASGSLASEFLVGKLDERYYPNAFCGTYYFVRTGAGEGEEKVKISTRFFAQGGKLEDPATGSAASALSAWLALNIVKEKAEGSGKETEISFQISQGVDMGRASEILTKVLVDGEEGVVKRVVLGGAAVKIMEGSIFV